MTARQKRPPRQVWLVIDDRGQVLTYPQATKRDAEKANAERPATLGAGRVVGPYVLAERARER